MESDHQIRSRVLFGDCWKTAHRNCFFQFYFNTSGHFYGVPSFAAWPGEQTTTESESQHKAASWGVFWIISLEPADGLWVPGHGSGMATAAALFDAPSHFTPTTEVAAAGHPPPPGHKGEAQTGEAPNPAPEEGPPKNVPCLQHNEAGPATPPPPGSAPLPRPAGIAGRGNGGPHGPRVSPSADRRCREWGGAAEPGARLTAVGAGPRRPLPTGGAGLKWDPPPPPTSVRPPGAAQNGGGGAGGGCGAAGKGARGWVWSRGRSATAAAALGRERQAPTKAVGVTREALTGWHRGERSCGARWPRACRARSLRPVRGWTSCSNYTRIISQRDYQDLVNDNCSSNTPRPLLEAGREAHSSRKVQSLVHGKYSSRCEDFCSPNAGFTRLTVISRGGAARGSAAGSGRGRGGGGGHGFHPTAKGREVNPTSARGMVKWAQARSTVRCGKPGGGGTA